MLPLRSKHHVRMKISTKKVSASQPRQKQNYAISSHEKQTGKATKYIHFILNQRTIPLHRSFPECEERDDGWCELDTFLAVQSKSFELSQYDWSCNGDYPAVPYGNITDGVPIQASP
jgi:hypothetical protein